MGNWLYFAYILIVVRAWLLTEDLCLSMNLIPVYISGTVPQDIILWRSIEVEMRSTASAMRSSQSFIYLSQDELLGRCLMLLARVINIILYLSESKTILTLITRQVTIFSKFDSEKLAFLDHFLLLLILLIVRWSFVNWAHELLKIPILKCGK